MSDSKDISMANPGQHHRNRLLLFLGLGAIALILLAAGMSNLDLQTGEIIMEPIEEALVARDKDEEAAAAPVFVDPTNITTILILAGIALFVIFAAIRWKQIRIALLVLGLFSASIIGMVYLYTIYGEPPEQSGEEDARPPDIEETRLDADLLNNPPDWIDSLSIIVAISVAVIAVGVVIFLMRKPWQKDIGALDLIAADAEAALADIRAGGDLRDAVLRCYFEMSQSMRKSIGVVRQEGMTPREFEISLIDAGLPKDSVHRLTRLFESVRYGRHDASEGEIRQAVDCLEEIVVAAHQQKDESPHTQAHVQPA